MSKKRRQYKRQTEVEESSSGLFIWTIFIVLLFGVAFLCWAGSIYVFGHPERPLSYSILQKLDKIEPPRKFELRKAPKGEYFSAPKFVSAFDELEPGQMDSLNTELLRAYLRNYQETKLEVPYLTGRYKITQVFELQDTDTFPNGVVALADSIDEPGLSIEYIYSADPDNVPRILRTLQPGLEIELQRTHELSAVTHLTRLADGRLQATVININYGSYTPSEGTGGFALEPPPRLNLETGFPVIKPVVRGDLEPSVALANATPPPRPMNTPVPSRPLASSTPAPMITPTPAMARVEPSPTNERIARAEPVATPVVATPNPASEQVARAIPVSTPQPLTTPAPTPTAVASNERVARALPVTDLPGNSPGNAPSEVPTTVGTAPPATGTPALQPFISATDNSAGSGDSWTTYSPGQMPRGRLIGVEDVESLARSGVAGERFYLSGQFLVTAADRNRAIMRSRSTVADNVFGGSRNVRFIVDYPSGVAAPREGVVVDKDGNRAFQVTDVQRSSNGVVNVYAREVIAP